MTSNTPLNELVEVREAKIQRMIDGIEEYGEPGTITMRAGSYKGKQRHNRNRGN